MQGLVQGHAAEQSKVPVVPQLGQNPGPQLADSGLYSGPIGNQRRRPPRRRLPPRTCAPCRSAIRAEEAKAVSAQSSSNNT